MAQIYLIRPVQNCVGWRNRLQRKFNLVVGFFKKPAVELVGGLVIAGALAVYWLFFGQGILKAIFRVYLW